MGNAHWPLFGLEVRTPRLTLRYPDDELLVEVLSVAANGVHDPAFMPFAVPWTRLTSPDFEREALRFHWRSRAETNAESFRISLAVFDETDGGRLVGMSELHAVDYPTLRTFGTGSWLGRTYQGRGIGTEMRLATLALGFDGLDAAEATTGAWHDNPASLGVTRSLGYRSEGRRRASREGTADDELRFSMDRAHFATIRRDDIEFVGLDAVREFLHLP